jgi:hypothetical protein
VKFNKKFFLQNPLKLASLILMNEHNSYIWLKKPQFPLIEVIGFCAIVIWMAFAFQQGTSMALSFPQWDGNLLHPAPTQHVIQTPGGSELMVP